MVSDLMIERQEEDEKAAALDRRYESVARGIANEMTRSQAFKVYDDVMFAREDALTNPSKHSFDEDEDGNRWPVYFSSDCQLPEEMITVKNEAQVAAIKRDLES